MVAASLQTTMSPSSSKRLWPGFSNSNTRTKTKPSQGGRPTRFWSQHATCSTTGVSRRVLPNAAPLDKQCVHRLPAQHTRHKGSAHKDPAYSSQSSACPHSSIYRRSSRPQGPDIHKLPLSPPSCTHPYKRRDQTGTDCERTKRSLISPSCLTA